MIIFKPHSRSINSITAARVQRAKSILSCSGRFSWIILRISCSCSSVNLREDCTGRPRWPDFNPIRTILLVTVDGSSHRRVTQTNFGCDLAAITVRFQARITCLRCSNCSDGLNLRASSRSMHVGSKCRRKESLFTGRIYGSLHTVILSEVWHVFCAKRSRRICFLFGLEKYRFLATLRMTFLV
jgi:hypothetical protein